MKQFKNPPPDKQNPNGRRSAGGSLTHYLDRNERGEPVPHDYDSMRRELWKWTFRYKGRCLNIPALDWRDAESEANKQIGAWDAEAQQQHPVPSTPSQPSTVTVKQLADLFLEHKAAQQGTRPATLKGYRLELAKHVLPTLGKLRAAEVTRDNIKALLFNGGRSRFATARTHNKTYQTVHSLFEHGVLLKVVPENPAEPKLHRMKGNGKRLKRTRTKLSGTQLDLVVAAALKHEDPRLGLAVLLAGYGGLRLRELTHLRVRDVTITDDLLDVHVDTDFQCSCSDCAANDGQRLNKTDIDRYVPFLPEHAPVFQAQLDRLRALGLGGKDTPLLAVTERRTRSREQVGDPTPADWLAEQVKALLVGVLEQPLQPRERFHLLRAAARVRLAHAGLSTEQIDMILGHELEGARAAYSYQDRKGLYQVSCRAFGVAREELLKKIS
ncbi:MAG: tyrosine-type recombinase/integrase [Gemmatimonadales bacterium]